MKTLPFQPTLLATALTAGALVLATPAQAVVISASVTAASSLPTTAAVTQDLANGPFLIHANPSAGPGHVTGDGVDEATSWAFDFTAHPQYAAFMAEGGLAEARLTLTLNTAFFVGGVGPITDLVRPSDAGGDVFPGWTMPGFISGTGGTYSSGSITTSLVAQVGMNAGALHNWLASHNGLFPMLYADDAIVTDASLTLVSAPVPEPAAAWLLLGGAAALLARRQALAARSPAYSGA